MVPISFALKNLADNSYARLTQTQNLVIKLPQKPQQENPASGNGGAGTGATTNTGTTNNPGATTTPGTTTNPGTTTTPGATTDSGSTTNPGTTTPSQPASTQETASKINGTNVPASAYNGDTSLILVGKKGYYKCSSISVEQGSGVKTYYYDVPADEIEVCVASWSDSEFTTVTVNGISMLKNKTVYSFRDVHGNTISLDTVSSSGKRVHNLLVVRKR